MSLGRSLEGVTLRGGVLAEKTSAGRRCASGGGAPGGNTLRHTAAAAAVCGRAGRPASIPPLSRTGRAAARTPARVDRAGVQVPQGLGRVWLDERITGGAGACSGRDCPGEGPPQSGHGQARVRSCARGRRVWCGPRIEQDAGDGVVHVENGSRDERSVAGPQARLRGFLRGVAPPRS